MRTFALSAVAACLLASPALAQSGPPEAASLPHRQGLSMEMPSFSQPGSFDRTSRIFASSPTRTISQWYFLAARTEPKTISSGA